MTLGFDVTPDASSGTCTMKYSPKVNEAICRNTSVLDVHPLQNPSSLQGVLKILFDFGEIMCEISGMHKYSFQASSGAQGIYTNACLIRAYHESNGEGNQRDEIITTAFSHPARFVHTQPFSPLRHRILELQIPHLFVSSGDPTRSHDAGSDFREWSTRGKTQQEL